VVGAAGGGGVVVVAEVMVGVAFVVAAVDGDAETLGDGEFGVEAGWRGFLVLDAVAEDLFNICDGTGPADDADINGVVRCDFLRVSLIFIYRFKQSKDPLPLTFFEILFQKSMKACSLCRDNFTSRSLDANNSSSASSSCVCCALVHTGSALRCVFLLRFDIEDVEDVEDVEDDMIFLFF
jgi:hypothetical protein